jgi:hypothetical protein
MPISSEAFRAVAAAYDAKSKSVPATSPAPTDSDVTAAAALIILAGKKRRGEVPNDSELDQNSEAARIILAGKRRRGEA